MNETLKKRKIILYSFIETITAFALTIVASMWDWVNMRFTFSKIVKREYWDNVTLQTIMYSLALLLFTLITLEILEFKNQEYQDIYKTYREDKYPIKDKGFEPYIDNVLNPSIKKDFLHKKYEKKLYRLDKIAKDRWKIDFLEANKLEEPLTYNFSSKWAKRYFIKRSELEFINSDEYIDNNYEILSVRYPRVNAHAFTKYLDIKTTDEDIFKVENETAKDVSIKFSHKIIYSFMGSGVIALLVINPSVNELLNQANGWIAILIQYIIRVGMIIANSIMGVYLAKKIFVANFILPINNRNRILDEYDIYKKDHPALTEIEVEHKKAKEEAKQEFDKEVERQVNIKLAERIDELNSELDRAKKNELDRVQ